MKIRFVSDADIFSNPINHYGVDEIDVEAGSYNPEMQSILPNGDIVEHRVINQRPVARNDWYLLKRYPPNSETLPYTDIEIVIYSERSDYIDLPDYDLRLKVK